MTTPEQPCQLAMAAERLSQNSNTAGWAICTLCERSDFLFGRPPAEPGQQGVVESSLVVTCDADQMPLYPEVSFRSSV